MFKEYSKRKHTATDSIKAGGVIYEVAKRKCGGIDDLENALRAGRVKHVNGMYYFRTHEIAFDDTFERGEQYSREGVAPEPQFAALSDAVGSQLELLRGLLDDSSGGGVAGVGSSSSGIGGLAALTQGTGLGSMGGGVRLVSTDQLDQLSTSLEKCVKLAEKALKEFLNNGERKCNRGERAAVDLTTSLEAADDLITVCNKAIKYKKTKEGEAVKIEDISKLEGEVKDMTEGLVADVRQLKYWMPKKVKLDA